MTIWVYDSITYMRHSRNNKNHSNITEIFMIIDHIKAFDVIVTGCEICPLHYYAHKDSFTPYILLTMTHNVWNPMIVTATIYTFIHDDDDWYTLESHNESMCLI